MLQELTYLIVLTCSVIISRVQTDRGRRMIGASSTMKKDGSTFIFQNKSIQEFIAKQVNAGGGDDAGVCFPC